MASVIATTHAYRKGIAAPTPALFAAIATDAHQAAVARTAVMMDVEAPAEAVLQVSPVRMVFARARTAYPIAFKRNAVAMDVEAPAAPAGRAKYAMTQPYPGTANRIPMALQAVPLCAVAKSVGQTDVEDFVGPAAREKPVLQREPSASLSGATMAPIPVMTSTTSTREALSVAANPARAEEAEDAKALATLPCRRPSSGC